MLQQQHLYSKIKSITHRLHKWRIEKTNLTQSFSNKPGRLRILFITEDDKICQSQIFPFFYYASELRNRWNVELKEVRINNFETSPERSPCDADIVCLQAWFNIEKHRLDNLLAIIKTHNPNAKIVFFDSFAPTDLRLAEQLDQHIDLYIKKHLLRDRNRYLAPTRGDTNLVDYYGRLYDLEFNEVHFKIPPGFMDKLVVGPSFVTASYMLPYFQLHSAPMKLPNVWDIHGRLSAKGGDWYQMMRNHAISAMDELKGYSTLCKTGVGRKQYINELRSSKICFSPFGYGEVCWRDYEAVMCGSLLLKPDMSHIETEPDIFRAHDTYVPIQWDFSDFKEVAKYYLANDAKREKITRNAYATLHEYSKNRDFIEQMKPVFQL